MIIHIRVPQFWIAVEEQRQPELRARPVIIGNSFLEKGSGHVRVLMANVHAQAFGVTAGMTLAHARQLCPDAVILSPELPLYDGVWDEIIALLLTYTPQVESLDPGEAVCDIAGGERLFGHPVTVAEEIIRQIESSAHLGAVAGVGANCLVARLAAETLAEQDTLQTVAFIQPGQEAAFLAPFPITALPDIDPKTLLAFQVLGLKRVEHLTRISERAMESRFGALGRRLARQARGRDDRRVHPIPPVPALSVRRRTDDDFFDGLEPDQALTQIVTLLATDLSESLRNQHLAGRLVTLTVRKVKDTPKQRAPRTRAPQDLALHLVTRAGESSPPEQAFPNQDSRIHSMLPQPLQPGKDRLGIPTVKVQPVKCASEEPVKDHAIEIRAVARMATGRPVNDRRTLAELGYRLLLRLLANFKPAEIARLGVELQLEMRHFAPPEQLALPGLSGHPLDDRLAKLNRGESILASRFGSSPFRHLEKVNLDSVLPERVFAWGPGMDKSGP